MERYRVLLGGLGDDAHCVGISLIRLALEENGFDVTYLGIQNTIQDFLEYSIGHEIILVSSINGHSELYLNHGDYHLKQERYQKNKLWYIGGNLSVSRSDDYIVRLYIERGFTGVFPKPVDVQMLLSTLKRDAEKYQIHSERYASKSREYLSFEKNFQLSIENDFVNDVEFENLRNKILAAWKTGRDVAYDTALQNHKRNINMNQVLYKAKLARQDPIIQPRTGVADLYKQIDLLQKLQSHGMGIASAQLDAASRRLYFDKAQEGVDESVAIGSSVLNGYPLPIYGVQGVQLISHTIALPFQIRGGSPDHRFVFEVAIAGGASSVEGGFLSYLLPYEKKLAPEVSAQYWRYVDTLCGIYNKMGLVVNREFFGPLTSTLIEPSIAIVINIVESLFAASYGVKSLAVGLAEQGNRIQDIAAIQVLEYMTNQYLRKYMHTDVHVSTVYHQYMGAFPTNENKAEQLIEESSITAAMSRATRIMTKTPVEAFKIPDVEDNIRGILLTKRGIRKAKDLHVDHSAVTSERRILEAEVLSIMQAIEVFGSGNIIEGAIQALREGVIDVPFSPSIHNAGKTLPFRNIDGAIRLTKFENMPFPEWVKEIHREDLYRRMMHEGDYKLSSILAKDIMRISKCDYRKWPLEAEG